MQKFGLSIVVSEPRAIDTCIELFSHSLISPTIQGPTLLSSSRYSKDDDGLVVVILKVILFLSSCWFTCVIRTYFADTIASLFSATPSTHLSATRRASNQLNNYWPLWPEIWNYRPFERSSSVLPFVTQDNRTCSGRPSFRPNKESTSSLTKSTRGVLTWR